MQNPSRNGRLNQPQPSPVSRTQPVQRGPAPVSCRRHTATQAAIQILAALGTQTPALPGAQRVVRKGKDHSFAYGGGQVHRFIAVGHIDYALERVVAYLDFDGLTAPPAPEGRWGGKTSGNHQFAARPAGGDAVPDRTLQPQELRRIPDIQDGTGLLTLKQHPAFRQCRDLDVQSRASVGAATPGGTPESFRPIAASMSGGTKSLMSPPYRATVLTMLELT